MLQLDGCFCPQVLCFLLSPQPSNHRWSRNGVMLQQKKISKTEMQMHQSALAENILLFVLCLNMLETCPGAHLI